MAWTQSAPDLPGSFGTAPVPDLESLRRAALQASWRRDRRVAQRRVAVRWVTWYALRGLPLLAIVGAVLLWVLNRSTGRPAERTRATASAPSEQAGSTSSASIASAAPAAMATAPKPAASELHPGEPVMQLRLGSPSQSASATATATAASQAVGPKSTRVPLAGKATSTTESPSPQLKPDTWLHSQEP